MAQPQRFGMPRPSQAGSGPLLNAPFTSPIKGRLCTQTGDPSLTPHHLLFPCSERKKQKMPQLALWGSRRCGGAGTGGYRALGTW